jgi:xylulokinase
MAKILVLDLGTSYFKFALLDRAGRMCGLAQREPPLQRPEPGRLELPAEDFRQTIDEGVAELRRQAGGFQDVVALSFATQTNSFLLLDGDDRPLTPIILWPDCRAEDMRAATGEWNTVGHLAATTGIPAVSHQFMLAKLLWLRRQRPDIWSRVGRLCLISDYLTLSVSGRHVTEAGTAGLTALVDIRRNQWWPAMLDRLELDAAWLPAIARAGTDLGPILASTHARTDAYPSPLPLSRKGRGVLGSAPTVASRWGLPEDCRMIVGCLDQYAGAIGAGNVQPGGVSETTGTVLATVSLAQGLADNLPPAVFQGPAFTPGQYWRMAFGAMSANWLQWYRDQLPDRPEFETLTRLAESIAPGADGLTLDTAGPPSTPEAAFRGWTAMHTRGHAVRAILEAVAGALREQLLTITGGRIAPEIRAAGGAARSSVWLQIKADVLGTAVRATECAEPTSLGAAVLAEAALSRRPVATVADEWVCAGRVFEPDPGRQRTYEVLRSR